MIRAQEVPADQRQPVILVVSPYTLPEAGKPAAVEWSARQPWSTGKVGLLGKSYDGWTGLMAIANRPQGLAAVLTTPLFLTQGFLDRNTKPDGAFAYRDAMKGPKRAWFGQFDHVRGYEMQATSSPWAATRSSKRRWIPSPSPCQGRVT